MTRGVEDVGVDWAGRGLAGGGGRGGVDAQVHGSSTGALWKWPGISAGPASCSPHFLAV